MGSLLDHRMKEVEAINAQGNSADARSIKSLTVTKGKFIHHRSEAIKEIKRLHADIVHYNKQIKLIDDVIAKVLNSNELTITEHALLRFAERFLGLDVDAIYKQIAELPKENVVRKGNTIITVITGPDDTEDLHDDLLQYGVPKRLRPSNKRTIKKKEQKK